MSPNPQSPKPVSTLASAHKPGFIHPERDRFFFLALGTLLAVGLIPWLFLIYMVLS